MKQKIKAILPCILIALLGIIGIIGYAIEESGGEPIRVLFRAKTGNVIFQHREHRSEYELACEQCHHPLDEGKKNYKCRSCHRAGTDYDSICEGRTHKQCIGANCIDCHKENGMDAEQCDICHKQ